MSAAAVSPLWRGALAGLTGVLLVLSYPPFRFAGPGWVALAPLIIALDGAGLRAGFLLGWLAGGIGALGVTGVWIFHAARDYFHLSPAGALGFTVGATQVFVAVHFGLFGAAAAYWGPRRGRGLLLPVFFVASEYGRAHLLGGCPWDLLGHSQRSALLLQICDLTGVYGLSYLLACTATAVALWPRTRLPAAVAALAVGVALAYGAWRLAGFRAAGRLPVALVQANLANDQRGLPQFFTAHLQDYLDLTARALRSAPRLVVWPENAVGFFLDANPSLTGRISDLLRPPQAALLAGAPRAGTSHGGVAAIHNSAVLLDGGGIRDAYDKRLLLPFVERLPLRRGDGPYMPGTRATVFDVRGARFGVLICYEAIYAEPARELVGDGAQFLVNISNDSWFEAGAGPEQHYEIARFRALENHVSLVRVTNSGISGVIDPLGREIARLPARRAAVAVVAVPLAAPPGGSFYTRHGDVFAAACTLCSGAVLLGSLRRRRV